MHVQPIYLWVLLASAIVTFGAHALFHGGRSEEAWNCERGWAFEKAQWQFYGFTALLVLVFLFAIGGIVYVHFHP